VNIQKKLHAKKHLIQQKKKNNNMGNLDFKKIIIVLLIPVVLIGVYFIFSFFKNKSSSSLDDLGTFFPFLSESDTSGGNGVTSSDDLNLSNNNRLTADLIPILRQITNTPVAGATIFKKEVDEESGEKTDYIIRYVERATGHIYETTANALTQNRISNTTIPKIQEALWLDDKSLVIRYLDDNNTIKTFSAELTGDDLANQELEGIFLQDNIQEIIKFGNGIFYLLESGSGSIGVNSDKRDENKKIIFESPLKEWLIKNIDDRYINFTTKPAINISGFSFLFDTKTESFDKIVGEKMNLSTLTSNLLNILYSEYNKTGPQLFIYSNQEKTNTEVPLTTFPEKCVWNKKNTYLYCGVPSEKLSNNDLTKWYQGLILFSDNIWRIDTENNATEFLVSPLEFETGDIDMIDLILNKDENYLLFINKIDYSLWGLKLEKEL